MGEVVQFPKRYSPEQIAAALERMNGLRERLEKLGTFRGPVARIWAQLYKQIEQKGET